MCRRCANGHASDPCIPDRSMPGRRGSVRQYESAKNPAQSPDDARVSARAKGLCTLHRPNGGCGRVMDPCTKNHRIAPCAPPPHQDSGVHAHL
eukprot:scaffold71444_cov29-Tisochrysis_lutea.AAC.3